jgi:hypothetical protein
VPLEVGSDRSRLELLEPVDEAERVRVEERELLLDSDREVVRLLELLPGRAQLLVRGQALRLSHRSKVSRRKY